MIQLSSKNSTCTMIPTSLILVLGILGSALGIVQYQPEAVHIAYGDNVHDISITWTTMDKTQESIVQYGINGYALTAKGNSTPFVDGGRKKHKQYIHRVLLKDLTPGSKYVYQCGNEYAWSDMFYFVTAPSNQATWAPQVVIFGDMGNENAQSLRRLQEETQRGLYDAAIHVGDFAYDMNTNNAAVGDQFMRQIESIAAYLPYMTVPGNHEEKYNFSNYRARFTMPGESEGLWYSFNMGPVHFIGIETEAYYFMNYGLKQLVKQYEWLDNDLREANKPENRAKRPWIVTFGHRPMYCSNANADDCTNHQSLVRVGLPLFHWFGLEDLFYKHKVDLEIWAHEHSYERLWPMYNFKIPYFWEKQIWENSATKRGSFYGGSFASSTDVYVLPAIAKLTDSKEPVAVYNGSYEQPYRNYKAPVHIVTGSAGCKEGKEKFIPNRPDWSAYRSSDYGYTRLKAFNTTHLYLEQVSDDKQGAVLDRLWLIKDDLWPEYTPN